MTNFIRRTAAPAALIALAIAPSAHAQTVSPSGGVSAYDIGQSGISVQADPQQGATLGVDAGENGGLTVGAGPQGAQLDVNPGSATLPGTGSGTGTGTGTGSQSQPSQPGSAGGGNASQPSAGGGDETAASPAGPGGETGTGADGTGAAGAATSAAREAAAGQGGDPAGSADRRVDTQPAADRDPRGVAPVLDLIEKIPAAVWAALLSLGLIALGLWLMWVRGRRRLERNAWVDTESPEMNVVAFETLLAHEWARSDRYRRPLGLLLLELEEQTSDGGRRPLTGKYRSDAQDAITAQARHADTVAQLSASRFAVICPESSPGSVETLARALEHSLEAARVHARVGTAGKLESDRGPADLVSRAAVGIDDQPTWATPVIAPPVAAPESHAVPA